MVVIRLARGGAKARPFFNIVVADKLHRAYRVLQPYRQGKRRKHPYCARPLDLLEGRWRTGISYRGTPDQPSRQKSCLMV